MKVVKCLFLIARECIVVPESFVEKTNLSIFNFFGSFVKD